VRGQGHAPLLRDGPTIAAIQTFLRRCDSEAPTAGATAAVS
jgi:hypothetical protein